MKEKIMLFVIGALVGAVISTGAFYVYTLSNQNCNKQTQMNGGTPPEMPSGQNGQPPAEPNTQSNSTSESSN